MPIATIAVPCCPLCRSTARRSLYTDLPDRAGGIEGAWSFVGCDACGAFYQDPRPARLQDGYPAAYAHHLPAPPAQLQYRERRSALRSAVRSAILRAHGYEPFLLPWPARIAGRLLHAVRPLRAAAFQGHVALPRARRHGTLLDVGCGNGRFLAFAQLLGWRVTGIEPDSESAAQARKLTGAPVHAGFEEAALPPASVDAITLNHVLEHAGDPRAVLAGCRRALRPGGTLTVIVPNWRSAIHRLLGGYWIGLEPARHLVMFDQARLRSLLVESGFTVTEIGTTWLRDGSSFAVGWRLRKGTDPPSLVRMAAGAGFALADTFVRRGGGEILACATPSEQVADQIPSGDGHESGRGRS